MAIVCSVCDVPPASGATVGGACTKCGERLISVDTGDDLIGTKVDGRFEVLALLGRGGMGLVYRAKQLSIGREVALKVVDRRIEKDVASVKRFFREAKLASTLAHPNTVPIIDFGQNADGRLYFAMELVKGKTLLDEMNTVGPLPIPRLAAMGIQLCDALETAHDLQIVHRDLKLENVMLVDGKRDHVKILDFGLARSLVDPTTAMTATGLISGTPRYMPPEVGIDAAPPAPSQDMYAVGVMLAEMSIGRALWTAPTIEMLFDKKLETEESIARVPTTLKPLIRSLLATEPEKRPTAGQARELLRDLESHKPAMEIELEPSADMRVEVVDPYANLNVVSLDELPERKPPPVQTPLAPTQVVPKLDEHDPRFAMPAHEQEVDPKKLEIDPAYLRERSQRQIARSTPSPPVKTSRVGLIIALLLIAAVGGAAYYLYTYQLGKKVDERLPGGGVTIRITADSPVQFLVNGEAAGKTPAKYQTPKATKPIAITAPGFVGESVVPDQDRAIHLKKAK